MNGRMSRASWPWACEWAQFKLVCVFHTHFSWLRHTCCRDAEAGGVLDNLGLRLGTAGSWALTPYIKSSLTVTSLLTLIRCKMLLPRLRPLFCRDAEAAGVLDNLGLRLGSAGSWALPEHPALTVTNPPWGQRLMNGDPEVRNIAKFTLGISASVLPAQLRVAEEMPIYLKGTREDCVL